jgi:hypothetical protein
MVACGAGKDRGKRLLVPGVHGRNGTIRWNPVKREGFYPDNALACSWAYMATQQTKFQVVEPVVKEVEP